MGLGRQGGCEQRIKLIVKMQKKGRRGSEWGFTMSKISKQGKKLKKYKIFFFKISPNTPLIIPFQLTEVSS